MIVTTLLWMNECLEDQQSCEIFRLGTTQRWEINWQSLGICYRPAICIFYLEQDIIASHPEQDFVWVGAGVDGIASKMEASLLRETKCGRLWTGLGGKIRLTQDTRQAILGGCKKMLLLKSKKSLVSYFEWPSRGCLITLFKSVILLICHTCHIKERGPKRTTWRLNWC